MYAVESICLRVSIVFGLVAAVVTILYFTPMPDEYFRSCDRPCHSLDWPMICRFKIIIETQRPLKSDCIGVNQSNCDNETEGLISGYQSPNILLPGLSIQVCQNDVLVVDVINKLPGHGLAIHWRGQPQSEAPFMDGAPLITQCPINSYSTFQYKFRASSPGTHLWHAHAGSELADGIFGALIVRKSSHLDPQRKLYDYDNKDNIILISEWTGVSVTNLSSLNQKPKAIAVNGKLSDAPAVYEVKRGKRYRFRAAYGGGTTGCPINLSVEKHTLRVISLDGIPINPYIVNSIVIAKGERVDFVLKANNDASHYKIKLHSNCNERYLEGEALLNYDDDNNARTKITKDHASDEREFTTELCNSRLGKVCLGDVQAVKKMPRALKVQVDRTLYLPFDYKVTDLQTDFNPIYRINNISFTYPPSPLLTQLENIPEEVICNAQTLPRRCAGQDTCECVHVERLHMDSTVEIILIDQGGESNEHNFHLHGYRFFVVASRIFDAPPKIDDIKLLDSKGQLFKRNTINPVQKDTIRVPKYGVVALRFVAKNPGFWMLRDGNANQWTRGMDMVLQVGTKNDLPPVPTSFPTCGSWIGPQFFLL